MADPIRFGPFRRVISVPSPTGYTGYIPHFWSGRYDGFVAFKCGDNGMISPIIWTTHACLNPNHTRLTFEATYQSGRDWYIPTQNELEKLLLEFSGPQILYDHFFNDPQSSWL